MLQLVEAENQSVARGTEVLNQGKDIEFIIIVLNLLLFSDS